ncbi:Uncharacterized conserved protein YjiS, DUF1127 family [Polaromonas sp. YR568]|uniref:DUF1127 domain-containing protein n=1 Tax=Polaromonas sp. YR568 TaxID=1855301 RepID=UPI0008EA0F93|nr:DUF1127 domain-containing protein [Polaromonas sp. YR568]SFU37516.1 Uncharacterized conserved protein YjiS, DUF1127 family [Polaromonas sp. YR568]
MLTRTMRIIPLTLPGFPARELGQRLLAALHKSMRRQRDLNELRLMSDHQLNDLGIGRGEIPGVMDSPGQDRWKRY